jgi:hypothetical protein
MNEAFRRGPHYDVGFSNNLLRRDGTRGATGKRIYRAGQGYEGCRRYCDFHRFSYRRWWLLQRKGIRKAQASQVPDKRASRKLTFTGPDAAATHSKGPYGTLRFDGYYFAGGDDGCRDVSHSYNFGLAVSTYFVILKSPC